jgi:hypothetical protein
MPTGWTALVGLGTVCGLSGDGLYLFPDLALDDIPPWRRCADCEAGHDTAMTFE